MITRMRWALVASAGTMFACAAPSIEGRRDAALPAVEALRRGSFEHAESLAVEQQVADADNPYPRVVHAITRYVRTMHQLALDGRTLVAGLETGSVNQKYLRQTLSDAEAELGNVEADLAVAARTPGIALELCVACWEVDWNGDGRIDARDRALLEIEEDGDGNPIPAGDPRRQPTFRFDDGDVAWARAFVGFERAALDVLLAYDWSEVAGMARRRGHRPDRIVVRLVDRGRITEARQRILDGLDQSDAARRAYLAETDDDREWVPSPRQKSHPLPLPVDQALYDTWGSVVGDVRRLVRGDEGLRVTDMLALVGERVPRPPRGYLDVGHMLSHPRDFVLDLDALDRLADQEDFEGMTAAALGDHYVREMKPSPLPGRLLRMKSEVDRHQEAMGRKFRYLLWLN
jgi:hypothetical protein